MFDPDFHPTGDRIELPSDFADHLADIYDCDPPETVWEWWMIEGERSTVPEELEATDFYTDNSTRHEIHVNDEIHYAPCVLDALTAAAMDTRSPVVVRSTDPRTDTTITVEFSDTGVAVSPADAVISLGGKHHPEATPDSGSSVMDYATDNEEEYITNFCKYRNAFGSQETYTNWAADTDAITFPARADKLAALMYRLHRTSRLTLVAGIIMTQLRESLLE